MSMKFAGKKIWLVGASEGIGEAVARRLAQNGATLTLSARNAEKLHGIISALADTCHHAQQLGRYGL